MGSGIPHFRSHDLLTDITTVKCNCLSSVLCNETVKESMWDHCPMPDLSPWNRLAFVAAHDKMSVVADTCPDSQPLPRPTHTYHIESETNGRHFPNDIFKCIFFNENAWISLKISLKYVPMGPFDNIPALVQIMAWRRPGDKPSSEPMMASLLTRICVTRPQWVNTVRSRILQLTWINYQHG